MTPPRAQPDLVGHETAVAALFAAANTNKLHHGWLITGPAGIGKATLAYRMARHLLAGGDRPDLGIDPNNPVARRIAAGSHPDLFTIERRFDEKDRLQKVIVIDTVREVIDRIRLTPAEGGWRVVVIDGAEDLNTSAANALLKILEEPPARAILMLVTAAPGRLLPTIRSRCRRLALGALSDAHLDGLLLHHAPTLDATARKRLVTLAEGSIGTALNLSAEGGLMMAALVDEVLASPPTVTRMQAIADTVARSVEGADKFELFASLLRTALAARTRAAARAGAAPADLARQVALWQGLGLAAAQTVGLNLDKRAALTVAIGKLHGA